MEKKQCVLYERACIDCGECEHCDLDPDKICDNCMRCVNGDDEYRTLPIDVVVLSPEERKKYVHDEK